MTRRGPPPRSGLRQRGTRSPSYDGSPPRTTATAPLRLAGGLPAGSRSAFRPACRGGGAGRFTGRLRRLRRLRRRLLHRLSDRVRDPLDRAVFDATARSLRNGDLLANRLEI